MSEIENVIACDLLANEYKAPRNYDSNTIIFLAEAAARRIVKRLSEEGYVIRARD